MAKAKRRLKHDRSRATEPSIATVAHTLSVPAWAILCRRCAAALLGAMVVYTAYFPSDSLQVESGDALWFTALALILWTTTLATQPILAAATAFSRADGAHRDNATTLLGRGLLIDVLVWNLALWMMLAALATCPPGNLRQATNEAWFWIAAAAVISAARRLVCDRASRVMLLSLLFAVAIGSSVHALHQQWFSLPQMRVEYLSNPEATLQAAGIDAPRGSAQRMVFANRLLDGGPTANFALANSLAAVLMIAVVVPIGLLRRSTGRSQPGSPFQTESHAGRFAAGLLTPQSLAMGLLALVGAAALLATHSRSALVACLCGVIWVWFAGRTHKPWARGLIAACILSAVGITALMLFGDDEWMSAAPASLEFRLHYWKSTLAMLIDHPLFAAGPGGFRAAYLQYRLPVANETIADPHNFVFETLAAGGFIAGGLLLATGIACAKVIRIASIDADGDDTDGPAATDAAWIGSGAGVSLGLIWLFSLASGQLLDFQAGVFAVPVAIAAWWSANRWLGTRSTADLRRIEIGCLVAILTHLTVSGGWTVPGVALPIWFILAMLCRLPLPITSGTAGADAGEPDLRTTADSIDRTRTVFRLALAAFVIGAGLLLTLRSASIDPVQTAQTALANATDAAGQGLTQRADRESQRAIAADSWDDSASIWRSQWLCGRLVAEGDDPRVRDQWRSAIQITLDRCGDNPLAWRALGDQCLHLYQRFGLSDDLQQAEQLIFQAMAGNPTDLSLVAQAAVIADQQGDRQTALTLAKRAQGLSKLGDNIVRDLGLQQIYVVRKLGTSAARSPQRRPVKDLFRERLGQIAEPGDTAERSNDTANTVKLVE
ncbi:O-antigen ligase family protein [Stieleria sp. TO1_6]|uniref:O-antigen ligase family protein n=1 Tax=Stieleria tagensis TaxID=2956795 RepID=UPI00209BA569|nr:O-antigen ligase family protein [Stieleria tagensis]MCO8120495.1 O-antigen ligase family protein [Stieleria tagensis]